MKVKETINNTTKTSKRVASNGEQFIQAAALLTVAGFSYWVLGEVEVNKVFYYVVMFALVVIGLRGAIEMVKFLDKK